MALRFRRAAAPWISSRPFPGGYPPQGGLRSTQHENDDDDEEYETQAAADVDGAGKKGSDEEVHDIFFVLMAKCSPSLSPPPYAIGRRLDMGR
jgi:hypothetical protein